ncbi:MAG: TerB family tellurite resistance protein [Myxococcales bacterium]|nr:TerB family tellurite resistance protein [Myxococcales bacterium]MCB9735494.1 TerB family tellurite resistance protein [Deltaproteobacteria bacterium]
MASFDSLPETQRYLLWTLVQIARADGDLSPLEATYVEHVAELLALDEPSRETIRAALLGRAPLAEVAPPASHADRVQVYRDAVVLAASDGDVERDEHEILDGVAAALSLGADEVDQIWREAKAQPA